MIYSHSYEDPDTGEVIDVMVDEDDGDDEADEYRNARPRSRRGRGFRGFAEAARARRPRGHQHGRGPTRPAPRPRGPSQTMIVRDPDRGPARPTRPVRDQGMGYDAGEYFAVKKSALAEIIPAAGQIWASFLVPPEPPKAVGNDIVDRDNATLHRQALAQHGQNQTRILALSNLIARAAKVFL